MRLLLTICSLWKQNKFAWLGCFTAIFFFVLTTTAFSETIEDVEHNISAAQHNWAVLVQSRINGESENWQTLWSDGQQTKTIHGFVISTKEKLYQLSIINKKDSTTCPNGYFPFSYSIDRLIASSIGHDAAKVWLGEGALLLAGGALKMHAASCHEFKIESPADKNSKSYENTSIRLLSVYGHLIGLEEITESRGYAQEGALELFDHGLHTIFSHGLSRMDKRALDQSVIDQVRAELSKLPRFQNTDIPNSILHNYVLIPSGGGAAAEFAIHMNGKKDLIIKVPVTQHLLGRHDHLREVFVSSHPQLIPWAKVSFYTIAPDHSAVVYALNNQLFWQSVHGPLKQLGTVHEIRGWQWHNNHFLTKEERQILFEN